MKIYEIKQEVFKLTQASSSKQFKQKWPDLHQGRDLRVKKSWACILNQLIENERLKSEPKDIDIKSMKIGDLQKLLSDSEQTDNLAEEKHRQMYYASGSLLGWSVRDCDIRWKNIKNKAQHEVEAARLCSPLS